MPDPTFVAPSEVNAGDTVKFLVAAPDTPANQSWTGTASLYGPHTLAATVTPSGADFLVTFPSTGTAQLAAGDYRWALVASKSGERFTVATGALRINANPATIAGADGLEDCQVKLALIRTAIEGRLTTDHESYSIGARSIAKIPIRELVRLEVIYASRVRSLQNRGQSRPSLAAQFVVPGAGS